MNKDLFLKVIRNKVLKNRIKYFINKRVETFIFSTTSDNGKVSLINITDKKQPLDVDTYDNSGFQSYNYTYNSVVTVGEYIYMFGGEMINDNPQKFSRFSLKSKSFDIKGVMDGIRGWGISSCYDGKDYIYLSGALNNMKKDDKIHRYHIHENRFEEFKKIKEQKATQFVDILSFFYKDMLYIVPDKDTRISVIDPVTKSLDFIVFNTGEEFMTATTDGQGNIYVNNNSKLLKFNVETQIIDEIGTIDIDMYYSVQYHRLSENESYIYYICGHSGINNFRYRLETKEIENLTFPDDKLSRENCGSSLIHYYQE